MIKLEETQSMKLKYVFTLIKWFNTLKCIVQYLLDFKMYTY